MDGNAPAVRQLYERCLADQAFVDAVESDTAGIPHTFERLSKWGQGLRDSLGLQFNIPALVEREDGRARIAFNGFH